MKKGFKIVYIILFFALCALPAALSPVFKNDTMQLEKREAYEFPAYVQDGKLNVDFSDGFEKWLNDRLPFRAQTLTAANALRGGLLHEGTSNVIVGKGGWLYFAAEGDDYMALKPLTDAQIRAMAVTLSLIQENVTSRGGAFTFVPAPNKASVYGENMPAAYRAAEETNLTRLTAALKEYGVSFVDARQLLTDAKAEQPVYHRLDSHWNYMGALIAYNAIMDSLGREHETWADAAYTVEQTWRGDLDKLLYPAGDRLDDQYEFEIDFAEFTFTFPPGVTDAKAQLENFMSDKEEHDALFSTHNEGLSDGSAVYVLRDSFGRALLPFLIDSYEDATFKRTDTPDLVSLPDGTDLVYEIVERNLNRVAEKVPFMYAPVRETFSADGLPVAGGAAVSMQKTGYGVRVGGVLPESAGTGDGRVYLLLEQNGETTALEAFPVCDAELTGEKSDLGFTAVLDTETLGLSGEYAVSVAAGGALYNGGVINIME